MRSAHMVRIREEQPRTEIKVPVVMVVEDEWLLREQIAEDLRHDGWDVAELCRDIEPELPVIYTTANTRDPSRMVSGSRFLGKPIRIDALVDTCRSLVGG